MSSLSATLSGRRTVNRLPGDDAQRRKTGDETSFDRMRFGSRRVDEPVQPIATPTGGTTQRTTSSGQPIAAGLRSYYNFTSR